MIGKAMDSVKHDAKKQLKFEIYIIIIIRLGLYNRQILLSLPRNVTALPQSRKRKVGAH
jgi:hypothetical protein